MKNQKVITSVSLVFGITVTGFLGLASRVRSQSAIPLRQENYTLQNLPGGSYRFCTTPPYQGSQNNPLLHCIVFQKPNSNSNAVFGVYLGYSPDGSGRAACFEGYLANGNDIIVPYDRSLNRSFHLLFQRATQIHVDSFYRHNIGNRTPQQICQELHMD